VKSEAIKVRVKEHLVIDYVYTACELFDLNKKLFKVTFNKLSYQNSLKISLRYFAWKYWFQLSREAKNAIKDIQGDGCDSVLATDDEPPFIPEEDISDRFDDATINRDLYD
jgi:hypothetical protein